MKWDQNRTPQIVLDRVSRIYGEGDRSVHALRDINLSICRGEWVTLVGPSGCGKSTMLNLLSGIDRPTHGGVVIEGEVISSLTEEQLARWRGNYLGIVFQFFQLMPTLTAIENVVLPMDLRSRNRDWDHARSLLERVGLTGLEDHLPAELSGGEQQRVAIARALANDPAIIIADEPTGNLDSATGERILAIFDDLHHEGKTIVLVTHDQSIAERSSRKIEMRDGMVLRDSRVSEAAVTE